jgi:hypothetical protein
MRLTINFKKVISLTIVTALLMGLSFNGSSAESFGSYSETILPSSAIPSDVETKKFKALMKAAGFVVGFVSGFARGAVDGWQAAGALIDAIGQKVSTFDDINYNGEDLSRFDNR